MIQTKSKGFVLLLDGFNVVDRNFGRKVGACDLPLLSSSGIRPAGSTDALGTQVESGPVHSYSDRFDLARHTLVCLAMYERRSDKISSLTMLIETLRLPRSRTKGFRSVFTMRWIADACEALQMTTQANNASAYGSIDDCIAEGEELFAVIAKDESESLDTRAAACFALTAQHKRSWHIKPRELYSALSLFR